MSGIGNVNFSSINQNEIKKSQDLQKTKVESPADLKKLDEQQIKLGAQANGKETITVDSFKSDLKGVVPENKLDAALEKYQDFAADGLLDEAEFDALVAEIETPDKPDKKPAPAGLPVGSGTMDADYPKQGVSGEGGTVRQIQNDLQALGYFKYDGGPTGGFFKVTEEAVKKFQTDHNLTVTGKVDEGTWNAMQDAIAAKTEETNKTEKTEKTEKTNTVEEQKAPVVDDTGKTYAGKVRDEKIAAGEMLDFGHQKVDGKLWDLKENEVVWADTGTRVTREQLAAMPDYQIEEFGKMHGLAVKPDDLFTPDERAELAAKVTVDPVAEQTKAAEAQVAAKLSEKAGHPVDLRFDGKLDPEAKLKQLQNLQAMLEDPNNDALWQNYNQIELNTYDNLKDSGDPNNLNKYVETEGKILKINNAAKDGLTDVEADKQLRALSALATEENLKNKQALVEKKLSEKAGHPVSIEWDSDKRLDAPAREAELELLESLLEDSRYDKLWKNYETIEFNTYESAKDSGDANNLHKYVESKGKTLKINNAADDGLTTIEYDKQQRAMEYLRDTGKTK